MSNVCRIIYFKADLEDGAVFRSGRAVMWEVADLCADRQPACDSPDAAAPISVALSHAMSALGVVDGLQELPHLFLIGAFEDGILLPEALDEAARLLETMTYDSAAAPQDYDFLCGQQVEGERNTVVVQYRLKVARRPLQDEANQLAAFVRRAAALGRAVALEL